MPPARPSRSQRVVVVIPTYNEIESLTSAVLSVLPVPGVDVLIVDDSSPDGTGRLADSLAEQHPRVSVLHRPRKEGLGRAYVSGFKFALERGYDVIVQMDADGSHAATDLPRLIDALGIEIRPDLPGVVIGSRWVQDGKVIDWSARRAWLSRAGNRYARTALRVPVRDMTAGYRAYRAEVMRDIPLEDVESRGYCFQIDMTIRALDAGWTIVELADHLHRTAIRTVEDEPNDRRRGDLACHGLGDPSAALSYHSGVGAPEPRRAHGFCRYPPTGSPGDWSIG